jgi:hypothetical protein
LAFLPTHHVSRWAPEKRNASYSLSGLVDIAGNQPSPSLKRKVRPSPLEDHDESVAKSYQEKDVNKEPGQPSQEP